MSTASSAIDPPDDHHPHDLPGHRAVGCLAIVLTVAAIVAWVVLRPASRQVTEGCAPINEALDVRLESYGQARCWSYQYETFSEKDAPVMGASVSMSPGDYERFINEMAELHVVGDAMTVYPMATANPMLRQGWLSSLIDDSRRPDVPSWWHVDDSVPETAWAFLTDGAEVRSKHVDDTMYLLVKLHGPYGVWP